MNNVGEVTTFGHPMSKHFQFDSKWKNMNHGSFGTYPLPVRNALRGYQKLNEAAPDKFMKWQYVELLDKARERIADLLHAPLDECVFVLNATTGINTVLRNLQWKPKDAIIYFDTTYGAVEKTLVSLAETNPQIHLRKVTPSRDTNLVLPATFSEILTAFSQTISRLLYEGYHPKVAVIDTIVSVPGVRLPFERLIQICKEYGILSLIDGAHGIGQIPLDLAELDPDFFVSNCHKWLYTPRGCAAFFVPKRNQHLIRTTFPTSHGYIPPPEFNIRVVLPPSDKSDFVNLFQFIGTADNAPFYCVPAAMNFRANICGGEEAIYSYMRDIGQRGADVVAKILDTKVMDDLEVSERHDQRSGPTPWTGGLRDCAMANVVLPIKITPSQGSPIRGSLDQSLTAGNGTSVNGAEHADVAAVSTEDIQNCLNWMHQTMLSEFHTALQLYEYAGQMWVRLSGQIYLDMSDFEWLGQVLKEVCHRLKAVKSFKQQQPLSAGAEAELDLEAIGRDIQRTEIR